MVNQHKLNYIYSLLPSLSILNKIQKVHIGITSEILAPKNSIEVGHANSINLHLFKPKYFTGKTDISKIECQVATLAVAKHVAKAWDIYSDYSGRKIRVIIDDNDVDIDSHTQSLYGKLAENLIADLNPFPNIIFAKLDSLVGFLRMMDLLNTYKLNKNLVQKLFVELELHRINHNLISIHQDHIYEQYLGKDIKQEIFKNIPLNPVYQGSFLFGQNFCGRTSNFTVINLPWGIDLAYVLGKAVLKAGAENIYLIGGVGCLSKRVNVDDIFIADELSSVAADKVKIDNRFKSVSNISSSLIFKKKIVHGLMLCVRSSLDHPPHFSRKAKMDGVKAFDMESWGLLQATKEFGGNLSMIHYIMDLPLRGLGLGGTYYNKEFLKLLLQSRNRGKYFCFETVLNPFFEWNDI